jgi:hypothetical protein
MWMSYRLSGCRLKAVPDRTIHTAARTQRPNAALSVYPLPSGKFHRLVSMHAAPWSQHPYREIGQVRKWKPL